MEIKSFTTTVNDFFMIANNEISKFDTNKKQFVIPKYQREYKWSEEQVKTLISDINKHEKFLGNIILNEFPICYEIVDGQQRITTLFLILIALFNKNKIPNSSIRSEEQKQLYKFIKHKDAQQQEHLILRNESIGDEYLTISDNNIEINIIDNNNIYYQKNGSIFSVRNIENALPPKTKIEFINGIRSFDANVPEDNIVWLKNESFNVFNFRKQ